MRQFTHRALFIPGVVLSLLLGLQLQAYADIGDVSIGGVWICRLAKGANGQALDQRMQQIERNIYTVVNDPRYRGRRSIAVQVRPMGASAALVVDGRVLFIVTPEDVEGTGATPMEAASQWAPKLSKGLTLAVPDGNQVL
jgi:hypothetical protein